MRSPDVQRGRYVATDLEDGTVRISDTENDAAWIRSDWTIALSWQT